MSLALPKTPPTSRILPADPGAAYQVRREEIMDAVHRVLDSGWYIQGGENQAFEREFADYIGVAHALGTGSGTDALELALRSLGIGPGDAVVTVSHTAVATVTAIDLVGATPVLVDVDPVTFTMDPEQLRAVLRSDLGRKVRAVVPVHLYGHPVDMASVMAIAREHNLYVVEDCAQAHGATLGGRKVGSFGDFGAFSFYPTKNLGALGDGGGLVTDNPQLADRAQLLKQYGWRERYVSQLAGINTRLDELQATVLRVQLPHLDKMNDRRREIAGRYASALGRTGLDLPRSRRYARHVYHQYVVRTSHREDLRAFLETRGVGTAILYPLPVHLQPGYRDRVLLGPGGMQHTERLCSRILSLPVYPTLKDDQVEGVIHSILEWEALRQDA